MGMKYIKQFFIELQEDGMMITFETAEDYEYKPLHEAAFENLIYQGLEAKKQGENFVFFIPEDKYKDITLLCID